MGTTNVSFDQGTQQANERLMQRRQFAEQQRVQQQNTVGAQLLDAINQSSNIKPTMKDADGNVVPNPAYDQAQQDRRTLLQQYTTLNSPEQHATFSDRLHGLIFGHPTDQQREPALNPASPAPPSPGAPGQASAPAAASAPPPPDTPHPFSTSPHPVLAKFDEAVKGLGNHLSAFAHPLPAQEKPDANLVAKYYRDPAEVAAERAQALAATHGQYTVEAAKARGANVRPFHIGDANTADAIAKLKLMPGIEYQDENGEPITENMLSEAPAYMKLAEFRQGPNTFYKLIDQRSKEANIGGIKYQVNELGAIKPEASTALGNQTADRETMHQVPGMNPGEVVDLHGAQAPVRTGMNGAPAAPESVPPVATSEPTLKTRPPAATAVALPPSPSQAAQAAKVNSKRSASKQVPPPSGPAMPPPFAPGTMLTQGRNAEPVVGAMNTVAAQVFGGNGEAPIWSNAWMFDKPDLREALNKALTLNALAIPGTEDDPSFMQQLATSAGVTGWGQEQIRNANQEARDTLYRLGGDQAMNMFARMAGLQEDLSALRTATKASAAQGSIRTLVRAAPVYNVASSKNFRDQLGVTLNTAQAALTGYPAINPAYVDWWKKGAATARGGPSSANAPTIPSATKGTVSLTAAMALPENKGKTEAQVKADIQAKGYSVK